MKLSQFDVFQNEYSSSFQIRTKDNAFIIEFQGDIEEKIFKEIISYDSGNASLSLVSYLYNNFPKEKVLKVLNDLKEVEIFLDDEKVEQDTSLADEFSKINLGLVGTSDGISFLLEKSRKSGYQNVSSLIIRSNLLDVDLEDFIKSNDFIIVDADQWNPYFLDLINQTALAYTKPWLFIRGIQDLNGSVGPLFYGKDTGCYHCLSTRIKSHLEHLSHFEEYENYLRSQKRSAKVDKMQPTYSVLYDLIASIAIAEVNKFVSEWAVPEVYGAYLIIDSFSYDFKKHSFLKAPLCPVCKPKSDYSLAPWLEPVTLKSSYIKAKAS